ncbi:MAG: septum formation initiator family protein [Bacilli bacterium]|nr:septum formation initiator family protein [Bacilli bacterium]MDD4282413.1 septum formation initiator family protein [Bacilli bacterium]MDD4718447.1 septum formation initiator family protein [Bacilli bacterium]
MAKRKISKASKRRVFTFGVLSIFIVIYFCINSVQYIININKLSNEKKRLDNELLVLKNKEDNLKTEIQKLHDPDYIARYARENYLYSKDGEYVIRIDPKEEPEQAKNDKINHNRTIWISTGGIIVMLIFIKRKK